MWRPQVGAVLLLYLHTVPRSQNLSRRGPGFSPMIRSMRPDAFETQAPENQLVRLHSLMQRGQSATALCPETQVLRPKQTPCVLRLDFHAIGI